MTNIPKRRFKGFTDPWQQHTLGEVANIFDGTHQTPVYTETGVKFASVENIPNLETTKFISQEAYNKEYTNKQAEKGDVLMTRIGDIGTTKVIETDEPLAYYVTLALLKPKGVASHFLAHSIASPKVQEDIRKRTLHVAFPKKINLGEISQVTLAIPPSLEEQTAIGNFFRTLDNTITTQTQYINKQKSLKSAYLTEMFPAPGKLSPKRRFEGFVDEWQPHKLEEVAHFRRGSFPQPYGNEDWYDGLNAMPFVQVVDVGFDLKLAEKTKQRISELAQPMSVFVPANTVIVTLQGSIGRVAVTQYDAYVDRTLLIFEGYKKQVNLQFWAYIIQQKFDIEKQKAPGGTIKTITKEALSDFEVIMPCLEEQTQIGNFFKTMDNLIAVETQKLEKLQALKQAYLSEMFV